MDICKGFLRRTLLLLLMITAVFTAGAGEVNGANLNHGVLPVGVTPASLNISWQNAVYEDKALKTYEADGYCKLAKVTYRVFCIPKKKAPATYNAPFTIRFKDAGKVNGSEVDVLCKVEKIYLYPEWKGIKYVGSEAGGQSWINVSYSKNGYNNGLYAFGDENGHNKFHYDVKKYFDCQFSVVEKGTNIPVPCRYFVAGYDIDWYYDSGYEEYIEFDHNSFEDIYTYKGCFLSTARSSNMQKYFVRTYNEQGLVEGSASWYKAGVIGVTPQNSTSAQARITVCNSNIPILLGAVTQNAPVKKVDKAICQPGDTITYSIVQKNGKYVENTFKPYYQLELRDDLPEGVTYESARLYSGSEDITSTAGTLEYEELSGSVIYTFSDSWRNNMSNYKGQALRLEIKVRADKPEASQAVIKNSSHSIIDGLTSESNKVETTVVKPELTIEKLAEGGEIFYKGSELVYKIKVAMKSADTEGRNVTVTDELPANILARGTPLITGVEGRVSIKDSCVTCVIPRLKGNEMAVLSIPAEVTEGAEGTLRNTAQAVCDEGEPVSSYVDITIGNARPAKVSLTSMHTKKWQRNLDYYNSVVKEDMRRSQNTFWSGEYFVISSELEYESPHIDPSTILKSAYIVNETDDEGRPYRVDFSEEYSVEKTDEGKYRVRQRAILWDKSMFMRWGGDKPKRLIICCEYGDKEVMPDRQLEILVDNREDYYMLHRKK